MLLKEMKYSYNDIAIVPAPISTVEHRSDCNPYLNDGMLPIFTAPMSSVVNETNFKLFEKNKINAILPRSIQLQTRVNYASKGKWAAFSLHEAEQFFSKRRNFQTFKPLTFLTKENFFSIIISEQLKGGLYYDIRLYHRFGGRKKKNC